VQRCRGRSLQCTVVLLLRATDRRICEGVSHSEFSDWDYNQTDEYNWWSYSAFPFSNIASEYSRPLPSVPPSAQVPRSSIQRQESTSQMLSRSQWMPDCAAMLGLAAMPSYVDQVPNEYSSISNFRSASCQNLTQLQTPSCPSSDTYTNSSEHQTPITPSSPSLDVLAFRNQPPYAALNCQTREGSSSSTGTSYILNFNFVNNP